MFVVSDIAKFFLNGDMIILHPFEEFDGLTFIVSCCSNPKMLQKIVIVGKTAVTTDCNDLQILELL